MARERRRGREMECKVKIMFHKILIEDCLKGVNCNATYDSKLNKTACLDPFGGLCFTFITKHKVLISVYSQRPLSDPTFLLSIFD